MLTPQGHLYQVLPAAFLVEKVVAKKASLKDLGFVTVAGYPRPLRRTALKAAMLEGVQRELVALRLPVAGTPILSHSLYGQWSSSRTWTAAPRPAVPR